MNLGPGNVMYFIMLKQMAVTFAVMTLIAVPLLIFANSGNGVIDNDDLGASESIEPHRDDPHR